MPFIPDHPPTSAIGRLLRGITGPIPSPVSTTIGPGAIPLEDYEGYLRKVAQHSLHDLDTVAANPVKQMYSGVKNILGRAFADPVIEQSPPAAGIRLDRPGLEQLINHLIEAYHPTYLGPDGTPR